MNKLINVCTALIVGSSLVLVSSCSDEDNGSTIDGNPGSGGSATSTSGGTGGSATGSGGSTTGGSSTGGSSTGGASVISADACPGLPFEQTDAGETCVGIGQEAEAIPVDMYIMMDRSVSMAEMQAGGSESRWEGVRKAVTAFVSHPGAAGIGVGIQFFGQSGANVDAIDCDVSRYSTPKVPIALLPDNATALIDTMDTTQIGGITPTAPALEGALIYAQQWAADNFGRATVVVLVTDGYPTQCGTSITAIADLAEAAYKSDQPVRTYVIGLEGTFNLDAIARRGGTRQAFLIDEADVVEPFVSTMLNITSTGLACDFQIPEPADQSQEIDPAKVQVVYTPGIGAAEEIPKVAGYAACATSKEGGWYYDNEATPTRILVCPCTCARFGAGSVEIRIGCAPRPPTVR